MRSTPTIPHLNRIVARARTLPAPSTPDNRHGKDPRCTGSLVIQAAQIEGFGDLFADLVDEHGLFPAFPTQGQLSAGLSRLFPALGTNRRTHLIAGDIIGANDSGNFEGAWDVVRRLPTREGGVRRAKKLAGERWNPALN